MLRSITKQMCQKSCEKPEEAMHILEECYRLGRFPSNDELLKVLSSLAQKLDRAYIIVDALDECVTRSGPLKVFSELLNMNEKGNFRIFVSGEDLIDFRHEMAGKQTYLVVIRDCNNEAEDM